MRRHLLPLMVALVTLSGLSGGLYAARDTGLRHSNPSGVELLVFEVEGCIYCEVFRRDVLPRYVASPNAAQAPIRFIDINSVNIDQLHLKQRLTTVPTAVVMKNGTEVGRIAGYLGPEMFFKLVAAILQRAE